MDVFEIVKKLIGDVSSVGETHIDTERKKNLIEMIHLTENLLNEIQFASRGVECQEHSRKDIGQIANDFLNSLSENYGRITEDNNIEKAKVWFNEQLSQMEFKNNQFIINNDVVMRQDDENKILWVYYYNIWATLSKEYNLKYSEIRDLIKPIVEEHFKIRVSTPMSFIG